MNSKFLFLSSSFLLQTNLSRFASSAHRAYSPLQFNVSRVCGIVGIVKGKWLDDVREEAGTFSEKIYHEHVRASMMTNFDQEDDSVDDVKQSRGNGVSASGYRKLPKINASSQEEVMLLLQSMQIRIDNLERNAGIQSPPASQAGDMEESGGPITQESGGCTVQ